MLSQKSTLVSGALMGGLSVALGAFGAHALKPVLEVNNAVATYALAAQYQFYHALALLLVGLLMTKYQNTTLPGWAAFFMLTGIFCFSGSLYAMALTGTRSVVFITPLGGLFFLTGWVLLGWTIIKNK